MTRFWPPDEVAEMLRPIGWPTGDLTLDHIEAMEKMFHGTLAGSWAAGIVASADAEMPATSGAAFLDDDYHIVGIVLADGEVVGESTGNMVDGLDRPDACFALRAFWQGFDRVRPMPLAPVALFDVLTGTAMDGSRLARGMLAAAAGPIADIPDGAKVFVEVDPAQPDVVYDVWAVAPSTSPGGVGIWRRNDGQWMDDPGWLTTLRSDSPPNLLYLPNDSDILADLLTQVDTATAGKQFTAMAASIMPGPEMYTDLLPLIARGTRAGLSKAAGVGKGGNAETLRRYWAEGKGAAKIRWGTGGDWYRCTKQLRKYMGTRAKGYCNLLHKRVLGYYPATHKKMIKGGKGALAGSVESWRWQLRDHEGQWIDMNARVTWLDGGKKHSGYVVGSPMEDIATVQETSSNRRTQIPSNRLTVSAPTAPGKRSRVTVLKMTPEPTPKIPEGRALASMSDEQLRDLYWATRDHPDVPFRMWARVAREIGRRKIDVEPKMLTPSVLL